MVSLGIHIVAVCIIVWAALLCLAIVARTSIDGGTLGRLIALSLFFIVVIWIATLIHS